MLYFFYPQLRKLSGAERLILRLAAHMPPLGVPVTLVTHYFDASCRPVLDSQVRLIETGRRVNLFHNHYLDSILEYAYSVRLLSRIGQDASALVFFGPPSLPALFWSRRVKRSRLPHLYFCYEPPRVIYDDSREVASRLGPLGLIAPPAFWLYKKLDRAMAGNAEVLLGNSAFGAQRLAAAYHREAIVLTHGVDLAAPDPGLVARLRERHQLEGRCVLLTVNFLHPRKRIDLLMRAFKLIVEEIPNAAALIVGAGPERARLENLARELGLGDRAILCGFVPDAELPSYYALASLYIHTGKLESFGLSVLEASAAGLPVVSVNEGGPREIIADSETGRLVRADPGALADAAVSLLKDPARLAAMGAAARARAAELYSWERGAQTLFEVLQQCGGIGEGDTMQRKALQPGR